MSDSQFARRAILIFAGIAALLSSALVTGLILRAKNTPHIVVKYDTVATSETDKLTVLNEFGDTVASTDWGDRITIEGQEVGIDTITPASGGNLYKNLKYTTTLYHNIKETYGMGITYKDTLVHPPMPDYVYHCDTINKVEWYAVDNTNETLTMHCPPAGCRLVHTYWTPPTKSYYVNVTQSQWYQMNEYGFKIWIPKFLFYKQYRNDSIRTL